MEFTLQELIFVFEYISGVLFDCELEYQRTDCPRRRAALTSKMTTARLMLNKIRAVIEGQGMASDRLAVILEPAPSDTTPTVHKAAD